MWLPGIGWSDHWTFRRIGFPAVMVTDTAVFRDSTYHAVDDTPDRADFHRLSPWWRASSRSWSGW